MPTPHHDHVGGHRGYVARLTPERRRWLHTKPFDPPPGHAYELPRSIRGFAHVVEALGLAPGAEILDLGCGPGWMTEWLARCGYRVTGIDVSEDMIAIARGRCAAIATGPRGLAGAPQVELHAMAVTELPASGRFDAAIAYDAMHHFADERATLAAIRGALAPGGRLYVYEGVRPPRGSAGERELLEEMRRYGTLEAPFDPEYLVRVVREAGFDPVTRHVELDRLVDLSDPAGELRRLRALMRAPDTNTLIALNPLGAGDPAATAGFSARIEAGPAGGAERDHRFVSVTVTNTGARPLRAALPGADVPGAVNVGPHLAPPGGGRRELPRTPLPRALRPGESAVVDVALPVAAIAGAAEVHIDLVREGLFWFGDAGGAVARVPLR